jgi:hypothetical protein
MKHLALSACLFFCWVNLGALAGDSPAFKVEGVKASYSLDEVLTFSVTNLTSQRMLYRVGVLSAGNGEWFEMLTNLSDRELGSKSDHYKWLPAGNSEKLTWAPGALRGKNWRLHPGTYRFFIAFRSGQGEEPEFMKEISANIGSEVGRDNKHLIFLEPFVLR